MGLFDRFKSLAELAPKTLKHDTSTLVIEPNTSNEFLFRPNAELREALKVEEDLVALLTTDLVLIEARHFTQLKAGTTDDIMAVIEMTIACPDARLLVQEGGEWTESPVYEMCPAFARQMPVIHGQHMRADADEIARFHKLLRDHDFTAVEIGAGTITRAGADSRNQIWHLGAPTKRKSLTTNYGDRIEEQRHSGLQVQKLSIQPRDPDGEHGGFTDFASASFMTLRQVIEDSASPDEDRRKIATRMVSSLTGISQWEDDNGKPRRSPNRCALPALTVNEEPFSFWSTVAKTDGEPGVTANEIAAALRG